MMITYTRKGACERSSMVYKCLRKSSGMVHWHSAPPGPGSRNASRDRRAAPHTLNWALSIVLTSFSILNRVDADVNASRAPNPSRTTAPKVTKFNVEVVGALGQLEEVPPTLRWRVENKSDFEKKIKMSGCDKYSR